MKTVAETIRDYTATHLVHNRGLLFGQCITAVGWVGGTVPELTEADGIVELPTSDVSGSGFAVGAALAGRRPIFVCRYQGFMWFNAAIILNYAAKSKEMWNIPCPLFVRAIAMEGHIGPVATGAHHSMIMRMPGVKVAAPMFPSEWKQVWEAFLVGDDPVYCSEHRLSFTKTDEQMIFDDIGHDAEVTIIGISAGRLTGIEAVVQLRGKGVRANFVNAIWLKPFRPTNYMIQCLTASKFGVVVDSDFAVCGAAEHLALRLSLATNKPVHVLGLDDATAGFSTASDNLTPSVAKITKFVESHL